MSHLADRLQCGHSSNAMHAGGRSGEPLDRGALVSSVSPGGAIAADRQKMEAVDIERQLALGAPIGRRDHLAVRPRSQFPASRTLSR